MSYKRIKPFFKIALIVIFSIFSFITKAAPQNPPENVEDYRWLYEKLFTETDRVEQPKESFKSFYIHLLDSDQNFPEPRHIVTANLKLIEKVEGLITYVNAIKKKYIYDILKANDRALVLNVKIHLKDPVKNSVSEDFKKFNEKIKLAENIWNEHRAITDFNYYFKFDLVENEADSHFSVSVLDSTRGPYDRNWGRNWTPITIAHEIGHMLGLGDEYQTLSGKIDCLKTSLMCSSGSGNLMPHHYYFVLRRLIYINGPHNL